MAHRSESETVKTKLSILRPFAASEPIWSTAELTSNLGVLFTDDSRINGLYQQIGFPRATCRTAARINALKLEHAC
jgi:hypothetical protein